MPDAWALVTPSETVNLNRSFNAPQYEPGGVDGNAAVRRDGRSAYQRSGDGLRTPGPLRLQGRVWSDAQDIAAMVAELDEIREAIAACTSVVRSTSAGSYTYEQLAGGPPPEVTPDGLGGFEVKIELWPGRAAPTFVPTPSPEPDPECEAVFFAWYKTASAADPAEEERLALITLTGSTVVADSVGMGEPIRLVADREGVIAAQYWDADPTRHDVSLATDWTWTRPSGSNLTWDAAPDGAGNAYLSFPWNDNTRIYKVNSSGVGTLLTEIDADDLSLAFAQIESVALSADGSVLFGLVLDVQGNDNAVLIGIDTSDGSTLWSLQLASVIAPLDSDINFASIRTRPGTDSIFAGFTTVVSTHNRPVVIRLDFASGVTSAPAVTWTKYPAEDASGIQLYALAAHDAGVLVGYDASSTGGGDPHIVTAYDLDGNVSWRLDATNYATDGSHVWNHGIGVSGDKVLVGVGSDFDTFPTEGWGFVMLRLEDGSQFISGDFPLEAYLSGPVVGVCAVVPDEGPAN